MLPVLRTPLRLFAPLAFVLSAYSQGIPQAPNFMEKVCAQNPNGPMCENGRPRKNIDMDMRKALGVGSINPGSGSRTASPAKSGSQGQRGVAASRPLIQAATVPLGEPDWTFAHPNPDLVLSVRFGSLMRSALVQSLVQEFAKSFGASTSAMNWKQMEGAAGEMEQVCLSMKGGDVLILLSGKVPAQLKRAQQASKEMFVQPLSPDQVLLGSVDSIAAAARRIAAAPTAESKKLRLAAKESQFWLVANEGLAKTKLPAPLPAGLAAPLDLESVQLSLNATDQLMASVTMTGKTAEAAARMKADFEKALVTMPAELKPQGELKERTFVARIAMDQKAILAMTQNPEVQKAFAPLSKLGGFAGMQSKPERQDGKVKIVGLDEGEREVTLTKP
jgi:hypothetical protein